MKNISCIAISLILISLTSCNGCNKNKSREKPDVSNIKADVHLLRFDQDLFLLKENNFKEHQELMKKKYGAFYNFYVDQFIVGPRQAGDTANIEEEAVKRFVTDGYIQRLQDSINLHFADTKGLEEELTQSFKYFKYHFPEATIPQVITVNSGFSLGAFTYDKDILGIGLDLYLGGNNPDYDSAGVYEYVQHKMSSDYIARNSMEVLYNSYFSNEELSRQKNLIEAIVDQGKKLYFLSYVLPDAPDSLILGFTQKQTDWCEKSEYEIWKFMNDKDLLYKSNFMDQKRYLDEGPTTSGMPAESPGTIGNWIGLQVVRKFMKESGNKISLHDLVVRYDGKTIFEKAKYRPSKSVF
ncbi:MAG: hypothetical protein V4615_13555 [Bacteroidota bacterium]